MTREINFLLFLSIKFGISIKLVIFVITKRNNYNNKQYEVKSKTYKEDKTQDEAI